MEILNIDGTALPAPSAYKVQLSDLDSSGTGRTEDGVLVRERVRGGVAKISAGWAALSTADCAKVLNATAPDSMTVQYFFGGVRTHAGTVLPVCVGGGRDGHAAVGAAGLRGRHGEDRALRHQGHRDRAGHGKRDAVGRHTGM